MSAALAHQADFDVCWCKGSVNELIFKPLVDLIQGLGGRIQGGRLASDLDVNPETGRVQGVVARSRDGSETTYPADAVIFAVGITGAAVLPFMIHLQLHFVTFKPKLGVALAAQLLHCMLGTFGCCVAN